MKVITDKEYEEMLKDLVFLSCLEVCGVDNWEGYDYAKEMMSEEYED